MTHRSTISQCRANDAIEPIAYVPIVMLKKEKKIGEPKPVIQFTIFVDLEYKPTNSCRKSFEKFISGLVLDFDGYRSVLVDTTVWKSVVNQQVRPLLELDRYTSRTVYLYYNIRIIFVLHLF